jgi:hypothetical protein
MLAAARSALVGVRNNLSLPLRIMWLESGLVYKYSIQQYLNCLTQFSPNGVGIEPFPISQDAMDLLDAVDKYCEQHNIAKFLIVGAGPFVDWSFVDRMKDRNYVMCIDDSNVESMNNLQQLKNMGLKTLLVHWDDPGVISMLENGLVDYSCICYYPYYPGKSLYDQLKQMLITVSGWCKQYNVKFVPAVQCFGKAAQNWRFPTRMELRRLISDTLDVQAYGAIFFTPFTGTSRRGETFDGFRDHPTSWDLLINPAKARFHL